VKGWWIAALHPTVGGFRGYELVFCMTVLDLDRARVSTLLGDIAARDRAAFEELYDRTSGKLFGVLVRMLGDRAEAEDALQEVYFKVWRSAGRYVAGQASPMSWLIAIARNHAVDRLRRRTSAASQITGSDDDAAAAVASEDPSPEDAVMSRSDAMRIGECLGQLEERRAASVRAVYLDGASYQQLADRFDVPLNTMRTWLRRSLLKLRECLSE
jgi:RNA polymerase sigma-70 factor (ECF subfamily)